MHLASIGYQKSLWKDRLRVNASLLNGENFLFPLVDTRDQYYKILALGLYAFLDVLKFNSASIFIGAGGQISYTRGLLGTGGHPCYENHYSEYYFIIYFGGYVGGGIDINLNSKD